MDSVFAEALLLESQSVVCSLLVERLKSEGLGRAFYFCYSDYSDFFSLLESPWSSKGGQGESVNEHPRKRRNDPTHPIPGHRLQT